MPTTSVHRPPVHLDGSPESPIMSRARRVQAQHQAVLHATHGLRAAVRPGLTAADVLEVTDPVVVASLCALVSAALSMEAGR